MNRKNMKQKRQHERKKGRGKLLAAVLAGVMSFAMVIPNTAYAAEGGSADDSSGGGLLENAIESIADFFTGGNDSSTRSVSDYTVSGISPRGTTINLFD